VVFQPVVSLSTNRSSESKRWCGGITQRGTVLPGEFIPLAEHTGLILPHRRLGLREACHQAYRWHSSSPKVSRPASASIFQRAVSAAAPGGTISGALRSTGLSPQLLTLEITESVIMDDAESTSVTLRELKALGVHSPSTTSVPATPRCLT
jgi:EAL domain-containing protein (putative c-di-GMP-specific phosphodiesterase class I)